MRESTGWTYAEIGELTLPQARCLIWKGQPPPERLTAPADIRAWIKRVREDEPG